MNNARIALSILAALSFAANCAAAGGHHNSAQSVIRHHKAGLICPVSGDKIASVKTAAGHSVYKGKTYYFCCPACKPTFDKSPQKFITNAAHGKFEKM